MTYVEGSSLHPERGGASTFARYAFDEFWSFVAGWAILLDYLIVMAIGAVRDLALPGGVLGRRRTTGRRSIVIAAAAIALRRVREHPRPHGRTARAASCGSGCSSSCCCFVIVAVGAVASSATRARSPTRSTSARRRRGTTCCSRLVVATVALTGHRGRVRAAPARCSVGRRGAASGWWCSARSRCSSCSWASRSSPLMALPVQRRTHGARRRATSRRRCSAWSSAVRPRWLRARARATWSAASRRSLLLQARERPDARPRRGSPTRWPPTARSRARVGRLHRDRATPVRRDHRSRRCSRSGSRCPHDIELPRGHLRLRRDARVHDRAPVGDRAALPRARPRRARSGCRCRSRCRGRLAAAAGGAGRAARRSLRLDQRARAARGRALRRRRLDARRDRALRDLPARARASRSRERFTIPAEALQEAPEVEYGSILVPVFGEHARRRHRRHRRPARRRGGRARARAAR